MGEPPPRQLEVPAALAGERVDRAVAMLTGMTRRQVDELIGGGGVLIGQRPAVRSRRLRAGERLEIAGRSAPSGPAAIEADPSVEVPVVWCDDHVIVVDKPAGLVVHPGAGRRGGTLVQGLLARYPDLAALARGGEAAERPGVVHRLDQGTSGLLVVARTVAARDSLVAQLADRSAGRGYVVLVAGHVEGDTGLVDAPLGRSQRDPTRQAVRADGRPARTRYRVVCRYDRPVPLTRLACRLETGRTHQIRVHLASIGHPAVGDDRYGGSSLRYLRGWQPLPAGRQFLHAASLAFDHPLTGERLRFSSLLPPDLQAVLDDIGPGAGEASRR